MLHHKQASRPPSTLAWAVSTGLAAMPSRHSDQPGIAYLEMDQDDWLDALFSDWRMAPAPWPKAEAKMGLAALQLIVLEQRAILPPLPAFPARPTLSRPVLDKLWHHLDLAAWRVLRFTTEGILDPEAGPDARVGRLVHEGADLLAQFQLMMLRAYTNHGASALDYTEELADILQGIHARLDQAAQASGADPLKWQIPDYRPFLARPYPLPEGPRGAALPAALAQDLQSMLDARRCQRPLSTLLPLSQWYGALKGRLDPGWCWSPARDGRECAFILFESGIEDLPPWTPAQARELSRLCTAIHAWGTEQPLPPLPTLEFQSAEEALAILWRHQDTLFLAGSVLGVDLGILGEPDEPGLTKWQRRLREQWSEVQGVMWGTLTLWHNAEPLDRQALLEALPLPLGELYQALRNEIAKVDRTFLRFVPKPPETLLAPQKAPIRFSRARKR
ncbi:MAG: hypothetical protein HY014_08535 [Acidobacteria bacterium]|nr:hypothetical protein [Acidobacteriota bacterium]MBI3488199.1 hypothetical protein [Acidobacteriota bacterium]